MCILFWGVCMYLRMYKDMHTCERVHTSVHKFTHVYEYAYIRISVFCHIFIDIRIYEY
jgi:hypothetical protein